jgi:hypothetical protein
MMSEWVPGVDVSDDEWRRVSGVIYDARKRGETSARIVLEVTIEGRTIFRPFLATWSKDGTGFFETDWKYKTALGLLK